MILWKSMLQYRDADVVDFTILADRHVLKLEKDSLSFGHQYYSLFSNSWVSTPATWKIGVRFDVLNFGYYSDFYDCEHHVLSFGPFYVYWSR